MRGKPQESRLTSISKVPRVPGEEKKLTAVAGAEQLASAVLYPCVKATKLSRSVSLQDIVIMLWAG
jgi:hypothetical protein